MNTFKNSRQCIAPVVIDEIGVFGVLLLAGCASTKPDDSGGRVSVKSPDSTIEMTILADGPLACEVSVDGKPLLANSRLPAGVKEMRVLVTDNNRNSQATDECPSRMARFNGRWMG